MKRLFINIFMLFSSFFLFSDVKAVTLEPEIDLALINEDFYKIKEVAEEFIKDDVTYSDDFIIYYRGGLYVSFFKDNTYIPNCTIYSNTNGLRCFLADSGVSLDRYVYNKTKESLIKSGIIAYNQNYTVYKLKDSLSFIPLYSTLDIDFKKYDGSSSIIYNYKGYSSTINDTGIDKFKTLYMINDEYNIFLVNKDLVHQDESNKIKSFYDLCIEKIGYLATVIVGNYIYLSIFAIFILIFIFSLIKRRYL